MAVDIDDVMDSWSMDKLQPVMMAENFIKAAKEIVPRIVGTLKDGYVCNVPLPQVPRIQSAKLIAPSRCIPEGTAPSRCIPVGTHYRTTYQYPVGFPRYPN